MKMRLRGSTKFVLTVLILAGLNVATLYFLITTSIHYSPPAYPDCSQQKKIVNLHDDLFHQSPTSPHGNASSLPIIYMITPTYARPTQKADLTRLCYTLMHVPHLYWIVVEDAEQKSTLVKRLLSRQNSCKIPLTAHLNFRTSEKLRLGSQEPTWRKCRGAEQRNHGISWLLENVAKGQLHSVGGSMNHEGVVYFGDDDNTYDLEVFDEMRFTKKVSIWPVGLSGGMKFEGPTCENGKVTGWYAIWDKTRKFRVDMAGFAVNLKLLVSNPTARFDIDARIGHLESSLLQDLVSVDELEAKAEDCTKVVVWHTRTEKSKLKHEEQLIKEGKPSNPLVEV